MIRAAKIRAAKTDMIEAHEGEMAENQAQRSAVRDFAKTLAEDHTDSYGQLSVLASKTGVSILKGVKFQQRSKVRNRILAKALLTLELWPLCRSQKSASFSPPILGAGFRHYLAAFPARNHTRRAG
jgi:hypothetical protein